MADYDLSAAFEAIEEELISSMMRNFARHRAEEEAQGFQWSQWQADQLDALERYRRGNRGKFRRQFSALNRQIEEAITAAYAQGGADQEADILRAIQRGFSALGGPDTLGAAFFRTNERKLNALISATVSDLERAETAILRRANDQYRKIIFNAQVYANTGAGTYEKAVDMAARDFLSGGIQCVVYANGARHTLADYADMAIRTASKRAYLAGEGAKRQEWGISTVIINRRGNACPRCAKFAGKIFIDDVWSGGKRKDGPYPLLSRAIAQGLYHPRCHDSHTTWFPELSGDPQPYTREEIRALEGEERREQREQTARRQAKKYRRLERHSLDPENRRKYAARAEAWEAEAAKPGWDSSMGSRSWSASARRNLWNAEYSTTRNKVEIGRLYGPDGKRIFRKTGDAGSVSFTRAELAQMRGGVLTHNHPGPNYGCFSPADINMLRYGKLSEMRVVTPNGVYSIQQPKSWPSEIGTLEKLTDAYYDIDRQVSRPFYDRTAKGEISFLEADNLAQEAVVRELCERYGIPLQFDSWDTIREAVK